MESFLSRPLAYESREREKGLESEREGRYLYVYLFSRAVSRKAELARNDVDERSILCFV